MLDSGTWLPKCLKYWNAPYVSDTDEQIRIGYLSSDPRDGNPGMVMIHTALVPINRVDEVLNAPGGIGWTVSCWGPLPDVDEGQTYDSSIWIAGPNGAGDRLEPLVVSWEMHNRTVMMPDNGMLMCYGLCPRVTSGPDTIIWDNPGGPDYDVVKVQPLSRFTVPSKHSGAYVTISRQYLEDYASLKGCAVVAVFYEDRHCTSDNDIDEHVDWQKGASFDFPGRRLQFTANEYHKDKPVFCRLWGRQLVLIPSCRPVAMKIMPELEWPGYPGVMTEQRASQIGLYHYVYVSDQVLDEFEGNPEYVTNPEYGSVYYDGRWSFPEGHRVGRDYVAYDLLRLYECSPFIIQLLHRHAVDEGLVNAQEKALGQQNIGKRASSLVQAFLQLGDELARLGRCLGLPLTGKDLVTFDFENVKYTGWWNMPELAPLGWRASIDMTYNEFLSRCSIIYQMIEGIDERQIRLLLCKVGLPEDKLRDFRSIKLFACLMSCCQISKKTGLGICSSEISIRWDKDAQLEALDPWFALVCLRNTSDHLRNDERKIRAALDTLGIQQNSTKAGWGLALDKVYDKLTDSITELTTMLKNSVFE